MKNLLEGTVIKSTGSWYKVLTDDGLGLDCRISGKHRLFGLQVTNPVAVGDRVNFEMEVDDINGIIREIKPRKNYILRQSPRQLHQIHLLAANIDQAILITTIISPMLKQGFIDRFTMMAEPYDIPALIVVNKADLYHEKELDLFHELRTLYENISYEIMLVSTVTGEGIQEFHEKLKNKTSLILGQSGVGKSSLLNTVNLDIEAITDEISDHSGKGQHTTTFAEMYPVESLNARVIDTPGIKTLSFNHLTPKDLSHNFREIFTASKHCRFANCMHKNEPGCNVIHLVETGEIHPWRYNNYMVLLDEIKSQNYWERKLDY